MTEATLKLASTPGTGEASFYNHQRFVKIPESHTFFALIPKVAARSLSKALGNGEEIIYDEMPPAFEAIAWIRHPVRRFMSLWWDKSQRNHSGLGIKPETPEKMLELAKIYPMHNAHWTPQSIYLEQANIIGTLEESYEAWEYLCGLFPGINRMGFSFSPHNAFSSKRVANIEPTDDWETITPLWLRRKIERVYRQDVDLFRSSTGYCY